MKKWPVSFIALFFSVAAFADLSALDFKSLTSSGEDFHYAEYFEVQETPVSGFINLLNYRHIQKSFPLPQTPYNRDRHFGGWLRDETQESCLNTRGKVLIRDSQTEVTLTASGCSVDTGEWDDPYTGRLHFKASDIQIDHLVALKNAYMTGAHEWDFEKRCLYANYMGNSFHLLSVNGRENLKKSDHSPAGYTPPNRAYMCQFVKQWLHVKLIWMLRVTPSEKDAIQQIVEENHCNRSWFDVTSQELRTQRDYMRQNANLCVVNPAF